MNFVEKGAEVYAQRGGIELRATGGRPSFLKVGRVSPLRAAACQRMRADPPRRRARSDAP